MRRFPSLLLVPMLAVLAAACGDDDDDGENGVQPIPYQDDGKLTVMTRNLYLGAELGDVIAAAQAGDQVALVTATTTAWVQVLANNGPPNGPPARLLAIADEIAAAQPDVVGLQEVSLWRTQSPSDAAGAATPATAVVFDYLEILRAALSQRGLSYVAALPDGETEPLALFDVEVPISAGGTALNDVRLTDRQVILVREGVPVTNARAGVYANLLELTMLGNPVPVQRGWTAATVTIGGQPVTVFNTHLEAFAAPPRVAQAGELATLLDGETGRVVLVGDLNSTPGTEGHLAATDAGFTDAWTAAGTGDGFTCCFAPNLAAPRTTADLDHRIDYVLVRGDTGQLAVDGVDVVGEADADRTASSLWPSDHAGVVATITP